MNEDLDEKDLRDRVADMLRVLSAVGKGDYGQCLEDALPAGHPLAALYVGVNEMITALAAEQQRAVEHQRELDEKLSALEQQRAAHRELSTPIMEVGDGVLCLPVVGNTDPIRSADMIDTLLKAVVRTRARCTIVDITGIEAMDPSTADHFIRMAKAVRLLGAECVITGINPQIAQTIVRLGIDMDGVHTPRSLRDALVHVVGQNGRASSARSAL